MALNTAIETESIPVNGIESASSRRTGTRSVSPKTNRENCGATATSTPAATELATTAANRFRPTSSSVRRESPCSGTSRESTVRAPNWVNVAGTDVTVPA